MELIDTHLHVINTNLLRYPWLEDFEPLRKDHPFSKWKQQARRVGITSALHMEVDVAEADIEAETSMVESLMAEPGTLLVGAISACRPENTSFPAFLESAAERKTIKGFRRVLHTMPDEISQQPLFRNNIRQLAKHDLPFDICVLPKQFQLAMDLLDCAPNVQFVLDHCGVPDVKGRAFESWAKDLSELAKRPNLVAKISGITAYAEGETWTINDLRPYVEHCVECFGWDRIVWGSDWPVVTLGSSLPLWISATYALLAHSSVDERTKLFSQNAKRIWKL